MPEYGARCQNCDKTFDYISRVADRNKSVVCPHCGGRGKRDRTYELQTCGRINALEQENVRYSVALGCTPKQLPEWQKRHPGATFRKKYGGYVMEIKSRHEKLQRMKEAGFSEYDPKQFD